MKIAIAQINVTVGDIQGNCRKIWQYAEDAHQAGASLMVTPELALSGYPPEDLLLRTDFHQSCYAALQQLARQLCDITLLVGHPLLVDGLCYNAASLLEDGRVRATYYKHILPNYCIFDEARYFTPGREPLVFSHAGLQFGVLICADAWETAPAIEARQAGAQALLVLNASPFRMGKQDERHTVLRERVEETGLPAVYVNLVGAQDELVFDGASFVLDATGNLVQQCAECEEALAVIELEDARPLPAAVCPGLELHASVYRALCLGLRDYIEKNGFPGVILGLSGGIDSALTLTIAVDALGAAAVRTVMMPSVYTADISLQDARQMARGLGVDYSELPIDGPYGQFLEVLKGDFAELPFDTAEENLQARIRATLLMALSNKFGGVVLTTSNKSEVAVGYSTLYGDMAGGFSVLKDVSKTLVYALARYRNAQSAVIPERILSRPPSAELRHNQTDQDSLPPYAVLDAIVEAYVERGHSRKQLLVAGYPQQDVDRILRLIDRNEYKRRQAPVGIRITRQAFDRGRRYPITSQFDSSDHVTQEKQA